MALNSKVSLHRLFTLFLAVCFSLLSVDLPVAEAQINIAAKICSQKNRYANSKWYRTGPGTGGAKYFGTETLICYPSYVYWKLTGTGFDSYKCEEEYKNCKFIQTRKIEKVTKEDGKVFYYTGTYHAVVDQYWKDKPSHAQSRSLPSSEAWERYLARDGHVDLEHYVDPAGGNDACSSGKLFATYKLDYDRDHQLHLDMMHYHMVVSPIKGFPDARVFEPRSLEPLASRGATHCYKLVPYDSVPEWSHSNKLEGSFISPHTAISYTVRKGKVTEQKPMKACCSAQERRCLKLVSVNEACPPQSVTPPGIRGDGLFTPCALCRSLPVDIAESVVPPSTDNTLIGCCRSGKCHDETDALSCATSGGLPLESSAACPRDSNPCIPESSSDPKPSASPVSPPKVSGACTLVDDGCVKVEAADDCWKRSDHVAFIRGGSCESKKGGCCDRSGKCALTTFSQCDGEFFRNACPQICPEPFGSCTRYCPEIQKDICLYTTRSHCGSIEKSTFLPRKQCLNDSGSLDCSLQKTD